MGKKRSADVWRRARLRTVFATPVNCGDTQFMSNATLELSEHELYFLPPGTPATAPATRVEVNFGGEKRAFLARLVFREIFEDCELYYVFYRDETNIDGSVFAVSIPFMLGYSPELNDIDLYEILEGSSLRFWHRAESPFGIQISSTGHGEVNWRNHGFQVAVQGFQWDKLWINDTFNHCLQEEFLRFCERLCYDENSELKRAVQWNALSPKQKDDIAFGCENGDWKTLHRLFVCAQIVVVYNRGDFPNPKENDSFWRLDDDSAKRKNRVSLDTWAMRWQAALCGIIRPLFWLNDPVYVWNWRHNDTKYSARNTVRCSAPTAHELLEAQLELRDFLRPHLSTAEIEALMRPE